MPGDRILPLTSSRTCGARAMKLIVIICAFVSAWAFLADCGAASFGNAPNSPNGIEGEAYDEASLDGSSYSSSTIHLEGQSNNTLSPVRIPAGNGYFSSHPIAYNSLIGSRTQVTNKGSVASLQHVVESARGISGSSEYTVAETSYRQGDSVQISTTTTQMKIDETVTEGKVHIGVLQGEDSSGQGTGHGGVDPLINAWKRPAIEMEEDYIGTYHISKNITLNSSDLRNGGMDSWLNCCSEYFDFYPRAPVSISADDVFKCLTCSRNPVSALNR